MISTLKKLQAKKAAQENNGGFTLIELLIVIVVLGILAAVVVFSLGGVAGTSAVAACKADAASINTAIAAFQAQNTSALPTSTSQLVGTSNYLAAWPNNTSHYQFAFGTASPNTTTLYVGTSAASPTTVPAASGTSWSAYTAGACATQAK